MLGGDAVMALCDLVSKVGRIKYNSEKEHDCICNTNPLTSNNPCVHDDIINFIKEAVNEKLERDK